MISKPSTRRLAAALIASAAALLLPAGASAQSLDSFRPNVATCTTLNCGASQIIGQLNGYNSVVNPWVLMVRGTPNRCLRLEVMTEQADLKMTVVRSDGTVFTNDDKHDGTCTNCPRIIVPGVATNQFFTVTIAQWSGLPVEALFTLNVGEYHNANPNCSGATTSRGPASPAAK